ncbi:MAG: tetratricopeptide repeat protein [Treponema sp.]|nr:tetratricopeptide repeat protein [Treponema sp.]
MLAKRVIFSLVLCAALNGAAFSQPKAPPPDPVYLAILQDGIMLYGQSKWDEAITQLRLVQASPDKTLAGEALFWIAMAELGTGNYQKTIDDINSLESLDPGSVRINELTYQKGRAYFYLGRYEDAIITLAKYSDTFGPDSQLNANDRSKKAAALYWTGESLYAMGQLDRAGDAFQKLVTDYPDSAKYEVSSYRIALIDQKKIEAQLLGLLKYSHEESLRIMEEYQRRERAYDQAIISYQRRINDMLKDSRLADLEADNARYQEQLAAAEDRIHSLEAKLSETAGLSPSQRTAADPEDRLQVLRSSAMQIRDELEKGLDTAAGAGK